MNRTVTAKNIIILLGLLVCSCRPASLDTDEPSVDAARRFAICLWDNIAIHEAPSAESKYLTALRIGERVTYLDSITSDLSVEKPIEYAFIELSDGTKGWARKDFIYPDTRLVAIARETPIFSRADLVTRTGKSFKPLDLAVVLEQSNKWIKVRGRIAGGSWFSDGWIDINDIAEGQNELTIAQLVYQAQATDDLAKRREQLAAVINHPDLANSTFQVHVQNLTYSDPGKLLKENLKVYIQTMIDQYLDDNYSFSDAGEQLKVREKEFGAFRLSEYQNNNHFYAWDLFYQFSQSAAAVQSSAVPENPGYFEDANRLDAIEALAGVKVYSRTIDAGASFNYVNKDFVNWVATNLIPAPDDEFLGVPAQRIYDVVFRTNARDTWNQFVNYTRSFDTQALKDRYESQMANEGFSSYDFLHKHFGDSELNPTLAGVWIRRSIDGSLEEVVALMQKALFLYDRDWYQENQLNFRFTANL